MMRFVVYSMLTALLIYSVQSYANSKEIEDDTFLSDHTALRSERGQQLFTKLNIIEEMYVADCMQSRGFNYAIEADNSNKDYLVALSGEHARCYAMLHTNNLHELPGLKHLQREVEIPQGCPSKDAVFASRNGSCAFQSQQRVDLRKVYSIFSEALDIWMDRQRPGISEEEDDSLRNKLPELHKRFEEIERQTNDLISQFCITEKELIEQVTRKFADIEGPICLASK